MICLESDNESEGGPKRENWKGEYTMDSGIDVVKDFKWSSRCISSTCTTSGKSCFINMGLRLCVSWISQVTWL